MKPDIACFESVQGNGGHFPLLLRSTGRNPLCILWDRALHGMYGVSVCLCMLSLAASARLIRMVLVRLRDVLGFSSARERWWTGCSWKMEDDEMIRYSTDYSTLLYTHVKWWSSCTAEVDQQECDMKNRTIASEIRHSGSASEMPCLALTKTRWAFFTWEIPPIPLITLRSP